MTMMILAHMRIKSKEPPNNCILVYFHSCWAPFWQMTRKTMELLFLSMDYKLSYIFWKLLIGIGLVNELLMLFARNIFQTNSWFWHWYELLWWFNSVRFILILKLQSFLINFLGSIKNNSKSEQFLNHKYCK